MYEVTPPYEKTGKTTLHVPWENLQSNHRAWPHWHWWASCRTCLTTGHCLRSPGLQLHRVSHPYVMFMSALCFNPTCLGILENHWNLDSGNIAKDVSFSTMSYLMHTHLALQASKAQAQKPLWCLNQLWSDNTIPTAWFVFPYHMTNFHKCWIKKLRSHLNSTFNTILFHQPDLSIFIVTLTTFLL